MSEGTRLFRRSTTVQSKEGVIGLEITYTEKPGQTEGQFFTLPELAARDAEIRHGVVAQCSSFELAEAKHDGRREALEEAAKEIIARLEDNHNYSGAVIVEKYLNEVRALAEKG